MKRLVAVTIRKEGGLEAPVDPRFGRAFAFLIADAQTKEVREEVTNQAAEAAHGAGTAAVAMMSQKKIEAVISGAFGPKASQGLSQLGIEMWVVENGATAGEALAMYADGKLKRMEA